jgi:hypothetical protein
LALRWGPAHAGIGDTWANPARQGGGFLGGRPEPKMIIWLTK